MPLDKQQQQQADRIFDEIIYSKLTEDLTPSQKPFGYVLGGQPGAGKSRLTQILRQRFDNNMLVINGDDFRRFHPDFVSLYEQHGADASRYTGEFAGYITEKAIQRASGEQYHLIIEGTFRTSHAPLNTLLGLQEKGYQTGVAIITTPAETSWASVNERYEKQLAVGEAARMTPRSHHDLVIDNLAANADAVYREGGVTEFLVYTRERQIFSSRDSTSSPGNLINNELNRLNTNVLSPEHAKLMSMYTARLRELRPDMPFAEQEESILSFRKGLLERQKHHDKTTDKEPDFEP